MCRNDLIIIDEIGFAPLDHTGCRLLFRLVAAAYERRSTAIGSHSPINGWGRFLPNQPTAISLLDRLCHHGIVTSQFDRSEADGHTLVVLPDGIELSPDLAAQAVADGRVVVLSFIDDLDRFEVVDGVMTLHP